MAGKACREAPGKGFPCEAERWPDVRLANIPIRKSRWAAVCQRPTGGRAAAGDGRDVHPYPPYSARRRGVLGYGIRARTRVGARPRTTI